MHISITLEHFSQTRELIEKLAYRSFSGREESGDLASIAMELSSIEAYVKGRMLLEEKGRIRRTGFTASYFFTCVQTQPGGNQLIWANSLS